MHTSKVCQDNPAIVIPLDILISITGITGITFERMVYVVSEEDSSAQICITTNGTIPVGTVEVDVETADISAASLGKAVGSNQRINKYYQYCSSCRKYRL